MTNEEIKQNAEEYATENYHPYGSETNPQYLIVSEDSFIAGAHSRDEEIEKLKDLFSNSQRYAHSLKETVESMGGQLKNAVSMLKDIYEDDDYFCEKLLDIPEEEKICAEGCDYLNEKCILRYLKHYKKDE